MPAPRSRAAICGASIAMLRQVLDSPRFIDRDGILEHDVRVSLHASLQLGCGASGTGAHTDQLFGQSPMADGSKIGSRFQMSPNIAKTRSYDPVRVSTSTRNADNGPGTCRESRPR